MKRSYFFLLCSFLCFYNCKDSGEPKNVGKVIERTPEEMEAFREFAPSFSLPDISGQTIALEDLKGKVLYVDIWATWCGPCKQQIPYMQQLEEHYKGNDQIEIISVSIDRDADKEKWSTMVKEKQMAGMQLFAGKSTSFSRDYKISSIPRFYIIGKEGEIVDDDAPRPMDYNTMGLNQELIAKLDQLLNK